MKVLINCPAKFNLKSKNIESLGGIESLNICLAQALSKKKIDVTLSTICHKTFIKNTLKNIPISKIKKNPELYNFDTIISSNDASIFDYFKSAKKIFWQHNILQVEKAVRKNIFLGIILNNPIAVFVSNYLKDKSSKFFFFKKKIMIPNFLMYPFIDKSINYKRKPIFVWSVQRDRGIDKTINMWVNEIYPFNKSAKFHIYGIKNLPNKYNNKYLVSKNIIFKGRVNKKELKNIYNKALAMICLGYDETFCLNALEANSCGLPILTFGKTALNDYVKHKNNGLIVSDYDELSACISKILTQTDSTRNKFINNSIAKSNSYHINNIIKYWIKLI
jgi:glycosyltransferase involved in cell wall biosynthesis